MTVARRSPRPAASRLLAAAAAAAAAVAAARGAAAAAVDTAASSWWDPWRHHPVLVAEPAIRPVLVRWYEVKLSEEHPDRPFTGHTRYLPGGSKAYMTEANFPYEPLADAAARDRLAGWDLVKLPGHGPMVRDWLKLHLNRDVTLCLALRYNTGEEVRVPGYVLADVAVVDEADRLIREGMELPGRAGVWCKAAAAGVVTLPRGPPMGIVCGRPDFYSYDMYLCEADGSAPAAPAVAKALDGVKVYPNSRCPPALHDVWVTPNVDGADEGTAGKSWRTWHPQVDPVYWCYYRHEHGTAPHFMAPYAPRLDYTAWKNKRQDASHPGFKGYGMIAKNGTAHYITVHASTSELFRIHQRFHTVTFAAVTKAGEIVADLSMKGDFGPAFALPTNFRRDRRRLPVGGAVQEELLTEFEAVKRDRPGMSKRINVLSGATQRWQKAVRAGVISDGDAVQFCSSAAVRQCVLAGGKDTNGVRLGTCSACYYKNPPAAMRKGCPNP
ncbi:hypothetical protein I4F81_001223 [Pyropia yezoensis]|uniref:Uncharacterized protein n=1 Tax=Pyropia yezoensis TaxID=2788 RepID=A0ACC3BLC8_PYRYE|nr:hypothetical protein I4F81_001223 [Neopyropia yezoensis]